MGKIVVLQSLMMKTCFVITAIFVITCKVEGFNKYWPKGWKQDLPKSSVLPKEPLKSPSWPKVPLTSSWYKFTGWPKVPPVGTEKSPKFPGWPVSPKEPKNSPSWPKEKPKSPGWPIVAPVGTKESPNSPGWPQEPAMSSKGSRRRCKPFGSCIQNVDCGRNGICIGSFGSGKCHCRRGINLQTNDCLSVYDKLKKAILGYTSVPETNHMVMAFDKCMVGKLRTLSSPVSFNCQSSIMQFYFMCEKDLKDTTIDAIDVLLFINDNSGFGKQ